MDENALGDNFLRELLFNEDTRLDWRAFNESRDVQVSFGAEYGQTEVRLGKTWLMVSVRAKVSDPRPERPFEGLFTITTELSGLASPRYIEDEDEDDEDEAEEEEVLLARTIEKAIRKSRALDLESLCIVAGSSCWEIEANVHYLNYDGGLVDASCVGVIAALQHFRRPDTTVDGERVVVHPLSERPPVPLSILHMPICASWCFIPLPQKEEKEGDQDTPMHDSSDESDSDEADDGARELKEGEPERIVAVLDATEKEQDLQKGEMVITVNKDRDLCQITLAGCDELSPEAIMSYCEDAHKFAKTATDRVQTALRADFEARNRGNLGADLSAAVNEKPLVN